VVLNPASGFKRKEQNNQMKEKLKFISLSSGSSGNCYYLGISNYGILIDLGIGTRNIKKHLKGNGIEIEKILAVFITHDHADHIKSVGYWGEKLNIPIYSTKEVHDGIACSRYVDTIPTQSKCLLEKDIPINIKDFKITAFDVPHDSADNVGYSIEIGNAKFVVITDVGHITDTITHHTQEADYLVFEANYDTEMLRAGNYPDCLKKRISGGMGHISNTQAGEFLAANYSPRLKNIFLCHLSRENNHPELALKTVEQHLANNNIKVGKDVVLTALKRTTPSEPYEFEIQLNDI
jgi:phosphoribosyl 1,2-cyclic phosphodiesterase